MEQAPSQSFSPNVPRILIAGSSSGVGKTSITLALVVALAKRGMRVKTFKVGPDYLDPTYLALASGRLCHNLDGWMMGKDYLIDLFSYTSGDADICIIEGVMGLFDGVNISNLEGSSAQVSMWLNAPSLIIVNAHGVGRTLAAVVKGLVEFEPGLPIGGIVANFCGSDRHVKSIAEVLIQSNLPRLTGAIPRDVIPHIPRRHLGLVTADPEFMKREILDELGRIAESYLDVDNIIGIAKSAGPVPVSHTPARRYTNTGKSLKIGVAFDEAFHFYYQDNLETLEQCGFEIVRFSPIHDKIALGSFHAIYLGGGYPEEHAAALSENRDMLAQIRSFANSGKPIYGECGGLMFLSQGIETLDGDRFGLVGLLPAWTRMKSRLRALRYVEVTLNQDSLFGRKGAVLRGHEFHYSELLGDPWTNGGWAPAYTARRRGKEEPMLEGFQKGNLLISYVHAHFASQPGSVKRFAEICGSVNA